MVEFYFTVAVTILNIAIPFVITRFDRRRLDPEQLARAWNTPSWACAIWFFGPLSLPAHFWVTRRTGVGFLTGVGLAIAVFGAEYLLAYALEGLPT